MIRSYVLSFVRSFSSVSNFEENLIADLLTQFYTILDKSMLMHNYFIKSNLIKILKLYKQLKASIEMTIINIKNQQIPKWNT